jgi:hypothetical protein
MCICQTWRGREVQEVRRRGGHTLSLGQHRHPRARRRLTRRRLHLAGVQAAVSLPGTCNRDRIKAAVPLPGTCNRDRIKAAVPLPGTCNRDRMKGPRLPHGNTIKIYKIKAAIALLGTSKRYRTKAVVILWDMGPQFSGAIKAVVFYQAPSTGAGSRPMSPS